MMSYLPTVVVALGALWLQLHWGQVPDRWPIHWDAQFHVNGWATKNSAWFPVYLGLGLTLLLEGLARFAAMVSARSMPQLSEEAREQVRGFTALSVRQLNLVVALGMVLLTVVPPLYPGWTGITVGTWAVALLLCCLWVAYSSTRSLVLLAKEQKLEGWHGVIYNNPKDSRIWVPKLSGLGYTLNFAHSVSWVIMAALVLAPLALALTVLH